MYRIRTPGYAKRDPVRRWSLPDRVFFACGACHILASAFVARYAGSGFAPLWIRPRDGHPSGHIVAADAGTVFDYHGYSDRGRYLAHTFAKARRWWPGWDADLVALPPEVLVSAAASRQYDGLWLREPGQFLHDALPRAAAFLDRFPPPPAGPEACDMATAGIRLAPVAVHDASSRAVPARRDRPWIVTMACCAARRA